MTSESVDPAIDGKSSGSTARTRSRFSWWKSLIAPLCTQSQRSWRKGWQFVCCTAVPVLALMWAMKRPEDVERASSRRLTSFHAGPTSRKSTGMPVPRVAGRPVAAPSTPYQPTPNPSPFVVSTPIRECRLWSMRECSRLYNSSSSRIGVPEYASHRHIATPPAPRLPDLAGVVGRSARHGVSVARREPPRPHSCRMRVQRSSGSSFGAGGRGPDSVRARGSGVERRGLERRPPGLLGQRVEDGEGAGHHAAADLLGQAEVTTGVPHAEDP